ncbi:MAG: hypothetical protein ACUVTG_12145 [Candidatus Oleimicrobiaceae bacterium]
MATACVPDRYLPQPGRAQLDKKVEWGQQVIKSLDFAERLLYI